MNQSACTSDLEASSIFDESVLRMLDEPFELDRSKLRDDANYAGFDNNTGNTWIYPTNYSVRQYQYNIIKNALFTNTLVVLPTGLGKTFIAAVVMYNIYRWYPTGKIIFMAPTRPLVAQQIEACYQIMGIPKEDTVEITGQKQKSLRATQWHSKRVFFVTPQALMADLCDPQVNFPVDAVKLMVVDEAHRAKGRYAYTEVVQSIVSRNNSLRVLALSATPGRRIDDVVEVVRNLFISHIEVRWENSIDVSPFVHRRKINTIVVPFNGKLKSIRDEFLQIIDPYVRSLAEMGVVSGNVGSLNKNWLLMEQKRFKEMSMTQRHPQHSTVTSNFSAAISLYHALECLERHGVRIFLNFFDDANNATEQKYFVNKDVSLKQFLEKLRSEVGPNPFQLTDENVANQSLVEAPDGLDFGHPKFELLQQNLVKHFEAHPDSRAIVFCELRESVVLIQKSLLRCRPLLKPQMFVGQGSSNSIRAVTQKQQIAVMNNFRNGTSNVLIATCVAEEGIDVGEVDLIICFDISNKNPTRLVQRMGRTGRKRDGQVTMLVTEGREHDVLRDALANKDKTNKKIAHSHEIRNNLYRKSSRLVPPEFDPQCLETFVKLADETEAATTTKKTKSKKNEVEKKSPPRKGKRKRKIDVPPEGTQDVRLFFTKKHKTLDPSERTKSDEEFEFEDPVCIQTDRVNPERKLDNDLVFDALKNDVQTLKVDPPKSENSIQIPKEEIHDFSQRFLETLQLFENNNGSKVGNQNIQQDFVEDHIFSEERPVKFKSFDGLLVKQPDRLPFVDEVECEFVEHIPLEQSQNSLHSQRSINSDSQYLWTVDSEVVRSRYADQLSTDNDIHDTSDSLLAKFKTPVQSKAVQRLKRSAKPLKKSPLFQAFANIEKKKNAVLGTPESEKKEIPKAIEKPDDFTKVLRFFGLSNINDIFPDEDAVIDDNDDEILDCFQPSTSTPLRTGKCDARKLFSTSIKEECDNFNALFVQDVSTDNISSHKEDVLECSAEKNSSFLSKLCSIKSVENADKSVKEVTIEESFKTNPKKNESQKNIVLELDDDLFADESSLFQNICDEPELEASSKSIRKDIESVQVEPNNSCSKKLSSTQIIDILENEESNESVDSMKSNTVKKESTIYDFLHSKEQNFTVSQVLEILEDPVKNESSDLFNTEQDSCQKRYSNESIGSRSARSSMALKTELDVTRSRAECQDNNSGVPTQRSSAASSNGFNTNIDRNSPPGSSGTSSKNVDSKDNKTATQGSSVASSCILNKNIDVGDLDEIFADDILSSNSSEGDLFRDVDIPCPQDASLKDAHNFFTPAESSGSSLIRIKTPPMEVISVLDESPKRSKTAIFDLKSPSVLGRRPNISRLHKTTPRRIDMIPSTQKKSPFFIKSAAETQNEEQKPVDLKSFHFTPHPQLLDDSVVVRNPTRRKNVIISSESEDEEVFATCKTHTSHTQKSAAESLKSSKSSKSSRRKKRQRPQCEFIDFEVDVSGSGSDDHEDSDSLADESIIDNDENIENDIISTQMHQVYVSSIRSPLRPVAFRVPAPKPMSIVDIYSQQYEPDDSCYKENSFVVDENEHHEESDDGELSLLEIAERKLKQMRKEKRKKKLSSDGQSKKKRRIVVISSDSSSEG